jgi:uncharacterized protein (DUF2141 family)
MEKTRCLRLLVVVSAICCCCAHQEAPPGGPVDKTAPMILKTVPAPNAIQVDRRSEVIVNFSERVDQRSVQQAFFISPRQNEAVNFQWNGSKLTIRFPEPFALDRTYVITIGTNAKDLRNNPMQDAFQFAFSTGKELDNGIISGRVFSVEKSENIFMAAYRLSGSDVVLPSKIFPEYMTQCNADGNFIFSYLAPGNYRVFAIADKNGNQKFESNRETIGMPTITVELDKSGKPFSNLNFRMTQIDTIPPGVKGVDVPDRNHIAVRFNEAIADFPDSTIMSHFTITEKTDSLRTLGIRYVYHNQQDKTTFVFVTEDQHDSSAYRIRIDGVFDRSGNTIDSSRRTITFDAITLADTSRPKLIHQSVTNGQKSIPVDADIRLAFSEPLVRSSLEKHFALSDSGKQTIDGRFTWINEADVAFKSLQPLKSETPYSVHIGVDSVFDTFGNALRDTAIDIKFTTVNVDTFSSLSGMISDSLQSGHGTFYLTAIKTGKDSLAYTTTADSTGAFRLDELIPGTYLLQAFRDSDSDGAYSFGRIDPFVPAERFIMLPDSIAVRSRWPNEGNNITIPKY